MSWSYRCGWCGMPCDKEGIAMGNDAPQTTSETVTLSGDCCPDGDDRQFVKVSREMALDAQDPRLEGEWISIGILLRKTSACPTPWGSQLYRRQHERV